MSHVQSLGGYLQLSNGKEYAFCFICNNYPGKISDVKMAHIDFIKDFVRENL